MSHVIAAPEMVIAAADDLAGIGSTLGEATAAAAAPTTGIAAAGADDISAAIARVFGTYGQEFQSLGAHAEAFHQDFVNLLRSGAGAYLSTEVANATATAAAVSPYQTLVTNTAANLQNLGAAWAANPAPILRQIAVNQLGYAQLALNGIQGATLEVVGGLLGVGTGLHRSVQALAGGNFTGAARTAVEALSELTLIPQSPAIPFNTIEAEMWQRLTSAVRTGADLSIKFTPDPITVNLGLPWALAAY